METALYVFAVWFGLGALGTMGLLTARTVIRRSRAQRQFAVGALPRVGSSSAAP